jgi:hypothetical protein
VHNAAPGMTARAGAFGAAASGDNEFLINGTAFGPLSIGLVDGPILWLC